MNDLERSRQIFAAAQKVLPGGVNSPVRAFKSVGGDPPIMAYGQGPRLFDVDGNSYIDYMLSWGPLILGHAHPVIVETLQRAAKRGTSYGASTELELVMAQLVVDAVPSVEKVRFVNSGTEATMSALRLARGATGRDLILKFEGGYHGHADGLLAKAGSGVATLSLPDSPGVPADFASKTLLAPYNDIEAVRETFAAHKDEIAAVIVEPVAANMGVVPPVEGFLQGLRDVTAEEGALLIFDEVVTGFRVAPGGAQERFGVEPDLTCLGKVIGGGLPVGAYGGRAELMDQVAPEGAVYQAGTLSGNPLAMAVGIATLRLLREDGAYRVLEDLTATLVGGLAERAKRAEIDLQVNRVGSMFTLFFTSAPVTDYAGAKRCDTERFARFFRAMLKRGVYLPPSQFESWFTSFAHMDAEVESTLDAAEAAFQEVQS